MRKAFIAIPSLTGTCLPGTEAALSFWEMEAESVGWDFVRFNWAQDSLIAHARNVCVAKFLESDATDMIFLDSDVACGPGVFTRLMSHPVEFVCGVYRVKAEKERYAMHLMPKAEQWTDAETGLLEAQSVPFGLVRLSRSVLEKMVEANKDVWFHACNEERTKCYGLFNTEIRDGLFWGEDFYFCKKWREIGGQIWVDTELMLSHVSHSGTAYAGRLSEWLRK